MNGKRRQHTEDHECNMSVVHVQLTASELPPHLAWWVLTHGARSPVLTGYLRFDRNPAGQADVLQEPTIAREW